MQTFYRLLDNLKLWLFRNHSNDSDNEAIENYNRLIFRLIFIVLITDILVCFFIGLKCTQVLLTYFLTAHAYLLGGMIVGFIFGIPKKVAIKNTNSPDDNNPYNDNTNLEEISDWLTKIIVGVTLVQFKTILGYLNGTASNIAKGFYCDKCICSLDTALVIAFATIIFFSCIGLICGYLWARIKLPLILTDNLRRLREINKTAFNNNLAAMERTETSVQHLDSTKDDKVNQISGISFTDFLSKVQNIYNKNPIKVQDDLQKYRWGGVSVKNGLTLTATVTQTGVGFGLYDLTLTITAQENNSDHGPVAFLLHNTFPKEITIAPMVNGVATLPHLTTYEAFTVGAIVYDNDNMTQLELDLNLVKGYPTGFYYKN